MDIHTRKYLLPDHGYVIVRWAHELAKGRGAVVVEPDIEGIRRRDGALTFVDAAPFKTVPDGPLSVLRELLDLEALELRGWSKRGFARFHKRAAAKQAERICREQGSEAAVDWVLANATADQVDLDELRDRLGARLYAVGGRDEDFYRAQVGRCIEYRRRRRLNG
ncbi:hypothetical protein [Mycolicibacter icosiumassiliensis]|uniref:hypothetical protein n=1 Tax=Mycolicibacter icosiumassiliensis TaxID=1792835 RepID=UPI00083255F9|nr:hypothetical protein [Mycolicibacter icosiumassiliensis]